MTKMDGVPPFKFHVSIIFVLILGLQIRLGSSGQASIAAEPPGSRERVSGTTGSVSQFVTINETFFLKHLAVDPVSGRVYVGAVNRLYELDSSLRLEASVPTGPKLDNPNCHASGCGSDTENDILTNNVNKVLLVDTSSRALISCGSVAQGACHKYNLTNITLPPEFAAHSVAANDETSSTYSSDQPSITCGPCPTSSTWAPPSPTTGTTATTSPRSPAKTSTTSTTQSMLRIDVKYRDHFLVKYVYGFNASDYAYFVIVQKQSYLHGFEEQGYVSRLAGTCITDANYDSYTEVTLQCNGKGSNANVNYNIVQDARIIPAREDLAKSLGINKGDLVLVGVFAQSKGITNEPQSDSALCVYSLRDIESKFTENVHMCFNGSVENRNMDYISGPILDGKCYEPGGAGNIPNFCDVGLKISGAIPIMQTAAIHFPDTLLTSVALAATEQHTVAFVGTNQGTIKKVCTNTFTYILISFTFASYFVS